MKIEYAARTHVGHLRTRNEDSYGVWPNGVPDGTGLDSAVLAVADGMGGHPGGDLASSLAVAAAVDLGPGVAGDPPMGFRRLFKEARERIARRGRDDAAHRGMGTTLTAVALDDGAAWAAHIGDSRLYWIRGGRAVQITRDHTVAQDLIDAGALAPQAAEQHPSSHILTRCLGVCDDQSPDLLTTPLALAPGDRLLLASDGLVKVVAPSHMPAMLGSHGAGAGATSLVEATLDGGAPDNVTVIVIEVVETGTAGPGAVGFDDVDRLEWVRG